MPSQFRLWASPKGILMKSSTWIPRSEFFSNWRLHSLHIICNTHKAVSILKSLMGLHEPQTENHQIQVSQQIWKWELIWLSKTKSKVLKRNGMTYCDKISHLFLGVLIVTCFSPNPAFPRTAATDSCWPNSYSASTTYIHVHMHVIHLNAPHSLFSRLHREENYIFCT